MATKKVSATSVAKAAKKPGTAVMVVGVVVLLVLSGLVVRLVMVQLDKRAVAELLTKSEHSEGAKIKVTSAILRLLLESMINNDSDAKIQSAGKALTVLVTGSQECPGSRGGSLQAEAEERCF